MTDYPQAIAPVNHVEPVPRRIRAVVGGHTVIDTTSALYVWEWPNYPQYFIPLADIDSTALHDEQHSEETPRGTAARHGIRLGGIDRPGAARVFTASPLPGVAGTVRFTWSALDHWFEEDEEVYVHPRNPYSRVDALRSTRTVVISVEGVELARSDSPVMVFETGLPTRYYFNRTEVRFQHLEHTDTITYCPYKGKTGSYWTAHVKGNVMKDLAWAYDYPTSPLSAIAGLVAFYNEKVDIDIDGTRLERPSTHFS
ncbi:MAG TPA: DUF427 domain-containing protein [Acidimicrobiales bacterium]|nr:DUF427 domain-containing protein [Acidimicrobiales bacterium]